MFQRILFFACLIMLSKVTLGQVVESKNETKEDKLVNRSVVKFVDRSVEPAVIYYCTLTIPIAKLRATSGWKNKRKGTWGHPQTGSHLAQFNFVVVPNVSPQS